MLAVVLIGFFALAALDSVMTIARNTAPKRTMRERLCMGVVLALVAFVSWPRHAPADDYTQACAEGTMDAASMSRFCPPGHDRKMIARGLCWYFGQYGYEAGWKRGRADMDGVCK